MSVLALRWTELPQSTRDDLAKRGFVRTRFEQLDADTQVCLLAIRYALNRVELWHIDSRHLTLERPPNRCPWSPALQTL